MGMFDGKIRDLGLQLASRLAERSQHWQAQAKDETKSAEYRSRCIVAGVILADVANVITDVTTRE